jgi:hypothetical protein
MPNDIALSLLFASLYSWGFVSASIVRMITSNSAESMMYLPLFLMRGKGYLVLSLVNIALLVSQVILLVSIFVSFSWKEALVVLGWALLFMVLIQVLLGFVLRNIAVRYVACGVLTIIFSVRVIAY